VVGHNPLMSDETPPEQQGPQLNPQTGYPVGQPPAYPQQPYAQAPYPQHPVYQAAYQAPYQAPGFPGHPADLPKATTAMVVGIVALAGAVFCVLPILAAPVAWILGAQARGQIRRAPQQWSGEGKATAGMVLGIVGTVLLVLGLLALVIVIVMLVNDPNFSGSSTGV